MKRLTAILLTLALILSVVPAPIKARAQGAYTLSGVAHVQTFGDKKGTFDGTTLSMGTKGMAKRLESITINFVNNTGYPGDMEYRVHRQTYGWTGWIKSGNPAGTTGQSKRLEGIQIRLTGELAKHYSVKYRVHIQTYGDNQGWMYDGAMAGTEGESRRLENLEVLLVPRNTNTNMGVAYRVHRQTYGWENVYTGDGGVSGTTGQSKRLEGIEIALTNMPYEGGIEYSTHIQTYGWLKNVSDGMMSGTQGQSKRLEAIKIELTGEIANYYDIYYRVHAQTYGWLGWAKNGEISGTSGMSKRLEAIQIKLVKKPARNAATSAPSITLNGVKSATSTAYVTKGVTPQPVSSSQTPSQTNPSQGTSQTTPSQTTPGTILVDEAGNKWVWVVDDGGWDETIDVYETQWPEVCKGCGAYLYTKEERISHPCGKGRYTTQIQVKVGTKTIHHDGHWEKVN